jgi:quercetin dioxygenase-like cupin family protein
MIEVYKNQFTKEGFAHVFEWEDAPGIAYEEHTHQDRVSMYIVSGGLTFIFEDQETIVLKQGDRFDVPPGKKHTAVVGPEGCTYVVGEMIEGDS